IEARLQYEQDRRDYEQRQALVPDNASRNPDPNSKASNPDDNASAPTLRRTPSPSPSRVPVPGTPRQTGPQIDGLLILLDCSGGVTLRIQVASGVVQLHSDDPSQVEFTSDVPSIKDSIGCGPINPPVAVTVSYRRTADPAFLGEPIRVLFIDKNQK